MASSDLFMARHAAPALACGLAVILSACAGGRLAADPKRRPDPPCPLETSARYEGPPIYEDDPVWAPKKRTWEAKLGKEAASAAVRARLQGWPKALLADRAALPREDRAFLRRVATDTWRGLDAFTDREHGLPLDNVRFLGATVAPRTSQIGDYTNITNVGLHLIAVVAAEGLGLIDRAGAVSRLERTLATLERLEQYQGFFFNYYDTTTLERTSNFISFVDTSWLTAGLLVVRNAFPELAARSSKLVDAMDYGFFYDPAIRQMSHGYFVHRKARSRFHYGVFYTEARLGYLIAIGKGDAPPATWFEPVRIYPPACAGQTMVPTGTRWETIDGNELFTGHYEWKGVAYVPSWGGSMFEALMPTLVVDEKRHAPRSLGVNDERHVLVQRRFATEELGNPVWGMSPSSVPKPDADSSYSEFGIRILGMRGYKEGAVTPHAAALAIGFAPAEAIANLRTLAERYPAYGDFGFYDAVDPKSGAVAHSYLALDQSMVLIALANYLTEGKVQQHFASDPITQRFLPVLALESFFR
jgi:hypothetical protein